jgi:hypothetical protein
MRLGDGLRDRPAFGLAVFVCDSRRHFPFRYQMTHLESSVSPTGTAAYTRFRITLQSHLNA